MDVLVLEILRVCIATDEPELLSNSPPEYALCRQNGNGAISQLYRIVSPKREASCSSPVHSLVAMKEYFLNHTQILHLLVLKRRVGNKLLWGRLFANLLKGVGDISSACGPDVSLIFKVMKKCPEDMCRTSHLSAPR